MDEFNERMSRGNDRVLVVRAYYPEAIPDQNIAEGDPFSLANRNCRFVASRSWAADAEVLFTKTSGVGEGINPRVAPRDNEAEIAIAGEDTIGFTQNTTLYCRFDVETPASDWWTISKGSIFVELTGGAV
jgi:hypothetical protein